MGTGRGAGHLNAPVVPVLRCVEPRQIWIERAIENAGVTAAKANRTLPTSERRITRDGDPMHAPALPRVIVERAVLGAAVVPDRQRINLPAESAGKLWFYCMRHPKVQEPPRPAPLETLRRLRFVCYVE